MKCEFCKNKVSDKGFRCFIKKGTINIIEKKEIINGTIIFQVRICDKCLKKKGTNLEAK